MPKAKKSWREKLADDKGLPEIKVIDDRLSQRWGQGTFVIPSPREVDALMKKVPKGRLTTIDEMRRRLAKRHWTSIACPLTTDILEWIAAHAAHEAETEGHKRVTPYWRTLKAKGELNPKYPGGIADLTRRLRAEGHRVVKKGKRYLVADFEQRLIT